MHAPERLKIAPDIQQLSTCINLGHQSWALVRQRPLQLAHDELYAPAVVQAVHAI